MVNTIKCNHSRRQFLKAGLSASVVRAAAPWAAGLGAIGRAAAANVDDYRALVCVFLYGGNDYANTLVPYDAGSYASYQSLRPNFAYSQQSLQPTVLKPLVVPTDTQGVARYYALAPELAPLLPIFDAGQMAVLLNVGTLIQPTSKAQYQTKTVPLPDKLFSHNDQQSEWQSSGAEGTTTGWGGRTEDLFAAGNANAVFSCINVYGNSVFLAGDRTTGYQIGSNGSVPLNGADKLFGSSAAAAALRAIITSPSQHLFESDHARIVAQAIDANHLLTAALAAAPPVATAFPAGNELAAQLKMVARIASIAPTLGVRRQVFFVALGGFDNHDSLGTAHPQLLTKVGTALAAFHAALQEVGRSDDVTTFTASDFGRTLTTNNDGSDHGWGSMHFILGGPVRGRQLYGKPPIVADNGPDDVGQGRLLPTTSVDQYAATLGRWLGASEAQLLDVFPNLANFAPGQRNLGFV